MLRGVVRCAVVGAALALALHLYMLSGHSHAVDGALVPSGAVAHDSMAMDVHPGGGERLTAPMAVGVDMLATCLAVVGTLLLLGAYLRRGETQGGLASAGGVSAPWWRRARPRSRSPVELCVSRR